MNNDQFSMKTTMTCSALMTDLYQLTMLAGYLRKGMSERPAAFDLYFREAPYQGSYAVFAGLQPALDYLAGLSFTSEELAYLDSLGLFEPRFLRFLRLVNPHRFKVGVSRRLLALREELVKAAGG
jgi:nicotinic acid phosphoribosyltransferase